MTGLTSNPTSDTRYVEELAAPDTINTIPDKTLAAVADHGRLKGVLARDGGDAEPVLAEFTRAGVDDTALAAQLQREGTASFEASAPGPTVFKEYGFTVDHVVDQALALLGKSQNERSC